MDTFAILMPFLYITNVNLKNLLKNIDKCKNGCYNLIVESIPILIIGTFLKILNYELTHRECVTVGGRKWQVYR